MNDVDNFLADLRAVGLCAIIRCREPGVALPIARVLIEAGVKVLEVTLTTPDAVSTIRTLVTEAPLGVWVGAGTAISRSDVDAAQRAGARFLVTPTVSPAIAAGAEAGIPTLGGAWSPTEVLQAHEAGAAAVKIFPASSGGPAHMKAIRDPLPHIPLVAVGGVGLNDVAHYREAGAIGFGIGGPLIGDAARGGSTSQLFTRAEEFVQRCRS